MSITIGNPHLLTSLIAVDEVIDLAKQNRNHVEVLGLLVTNIVLGAIKSLEKRDYKSFDANPGDGGCQIRALELRSLVIRLEQEGFQECCSLKNFFLQFKKAGQERRNNPGRLESSLHRGFEEELSQLKISKEMEYLLHCYFSASLRVPYQTCENGVIMTRSDVSRLAKLSKNIDRLESKHRKKIVENHQKKLSMLSVEAIRASARQLSSLDLGEKQFLVRMLSKEHTHLFTPNKEFEPKEFGCLFYEMKTVLACLKEERGVVWPEKHCA